MFKTEDDVLNMSPNWRHKLYTLPVLVQRVIVFALRRHDDGKVGERQRDAVFVACLPKQGSRLSSRRARACVKLPALPQHMRQTAQRRRPVGHTARVFRQRTMLLEGAVRPVKIALRERQVA